MLGSPDISKTKAGQLRGVQGVETMAENTRSKAGFWGGVVPPRSRRSQGKLMPNWRKRLWRAWGSTGLAQEPGPPDSHLLQRLTAGICRAIALKTPVCRRESLETARSSPLLRSGLSRSSRELS